MAGGRIDLASLAANLQVDLNHIENAVNELLKTEKDMRLVLDQLISDSYMDQVAEEVSVYLAVFIEYLEPSIFPLKEKR